MFSPEDGSSMAVETCWLFKKLYRLEIRVKYLTNQPSETLKKHKNCLLVIEKGDVGMAKHFSKKYGNKG